MGDFSSAAVYVDLILDKNAKGELKTFYLNCSSSQMANLGDVGTTNANDCIAPGQDLDELATGGEHVRHEANNRKNESEANYPKQNIHQTEFVND